MYALLMNPTYLAMQGGMLPDAASFSLQRLCPYMTQQIEVKMYPGPESIPVMSWQLAKQIQECRKDHPELKAFRMQKLEDVQGESGCPVRLEGFENVTPGRLLMLTANLRRGLGDMLLMQPIFRAQAGDLRQRGWTGKVSISGAEAFRDLFEGLPFVEEYLPEMPNLNEIYRFDYFLEYGMALGRMRKLLGTPEWSDIDLRIRLPITAEMRLDAQQRFPGNRPKIFLHWNSFDKDRTLPMDWFDGVLREFENAELYCALHNDDRPGEIFPGGPVNLWPEEKTLKDLFVILAAMDAVVTTNTGVAHVSAALGRPTIVIFSGRLYGWEDYWPDFHEQLYPTMQPIGLQENLGLSAEEIQARILEKLRVILPAVAVTAD